MLRIGQENVVQVIKLYARTRSRNDTVAAAAEKDLMDAVIKPGQNCSKNVFEEVRITFQP